jgi:hypothetical protein
MLCLGKTSEIKTKLKALKERPMDLSVKISLMEGILEEIKTLSLSSLTTEGCSPVCS